MNKKKKLKHILIFNFQIGKIKNKLEAKSFSHLVLSKNLE